MEKMSVQELKAVLTDWVADLKKELAELNEKKEKALAKILKKAEKVAPEKKKDVLWYHDYEASIFNELIDKYSRSGGLDKSYRAGVNKEVKEVSETLKYY